jgi:hypothetical protein
MLSVEAVKANIFAGMRIYLQKPFHAWAPTLFRWMVVTWFLVFFAGQWMFAVYIFFRYWWQSAFIEHFERWNRTAPDLYIKGAPFRTAIFGLHAAIAAVVSLLGPLQVIPALRRYAPRFHRISGRIYVYFAFAIGLDGIILAWRPKAIGDKPGHLIVSINALIILLCALFTIRTAKKRDIPAHNRWAVHLLLAMSGVWLFRVFLMLWLTIYSRPVGFDPETFTGPFLTILGLLVYIFPQVMIWGYFRSKESLSAGVKLTFSLLLLLVTFGMAVGVFAAITRMWLPRIVVSFISLRNIALLPVVR